MFIAKNNNKHFLSQTLYNFLQHNHIMDFFFPSPWPILLNVWFLLRALVQCHSVRCIIHTIIIRTKDTKSSILNRRWFRKWNLRSIRKLNLVLKIKPISVKRYWEVEEFIRLRQSSNDDGDYVKKPSITNMMLETPSNYIDNFIFFIYLFF